MMCRLYIIVVSIERCAHGRPTWKYTEKGAYNKSLANLILSCIYASHCYQHQFSSSPFYNNAASCAAALLLIKAAFSARSPIARLTPAKYIKIYLMRGDAPCQQREGNRESARRALCCKIITKRIIKKDECKKSKSTFKWCVCWCLMGAGVNEYVQSRQVTHKGPQNHLKDFSNVSC